MSKKLTSVSAILISIMLLCSCGGTGKGTAGTQAGDNDKLEITWLGPPYNA